jgi:hypothetical protein
MQQILLAAKSVPPNRRPEFLELICQQLKIKDIDVADAIRRGSYTSCRRHDRLSH